MDPEIVKRNKKSLGGGTRADDLQLRLYDTDYTAQRLNSFIPMELPGTWNFQELSLEPSTDFRCDQSVFNSLNPSIEQAPICLNHAYSPEMKLPLLSP